MKADLGCGHNKKPGFVGVDIRPDLKPDIVHDLTQSIPFEPDSLDEVYSSHFVEHIPADRVKGLMDGIAVACMNGAKVEIKVPLNFEDPAHLQILGYDWIAELVRMVSETMVLMAYQVDLIRTTSWDGKLFSYEQATAVFKVKK